MEIRTDAWHYKVWKWTRWAFASSLYGYEMEDGTNLCSYVQRIFWMPLLWLLITLFFSVFYYGFAAPVMLMVGYYPLPPHRLVREFSKSNGADGASGEYSGLLIGEWFQLYPAHIIIPALLAFGDYLLWRYNLVAAVIIHGVLGVIALALGVVALCTSDNVVAEWVGAKKAGVCPLIKFKEPTQ